MARKRSASGMDPRVVHLSRGVTATRRRCRTLAERDGDETTDVNAHTETDTSVEGEIHPQLYADPNGFRRLGFDPIPA